MGEKDNNKVMISFDDGKTWLPENGLEVVDLTVDDGEEVVTKSFDNSSVLTLSCKLLPDKVLFWLMPNNWLKMHGRPMRRMKYYRKLIKQNKLRLHQ